MTLGELKAFAEKNNLADETDLGIDLEDPRPVHITGIIKADVYVTGDNRRLISFLPASCLVRKSMEEIATKHLTGGVTPEEKSALWRKS